MKYEPFRADMQSRFKIDGGKIHFDRHRPARATARARWSPATSISAAGRSRLYQVESRIDFPTQKNIFFHGQKFTASGHGDFTGTFHLFKGGRELKGTFTSPVAGVNAWRFPNLRGRCCGCRIAWSHQRDERASMAAPRGSTTDGAARPARRADARVVGRAVQGRRSAALTDFLETQGLRLAGRATGPEPSRVAARQVGAEARRRRGDRDAARGRDGR